MGSSSAEPHGVLEGLARDGLIKISELLNSSISRPTILRSRSGKGSLLSHFLPPLPEQIAGVSRNQIGVQYCMEPSLCPNRLLENTRSAV